jgi:hypothetical protein
VHPNDNGHLLIAYLLYSFIKTVSLQADTLPLVSLTMPPALTTDLYEFAEIHSSDPNDPFLVKTNAGWATIEKYRRLGYTSSHRGDSLVFRTAVKEVTVGYTYSKDLNGAIQIKLDGQTIDTVCNHDTEQWNAGYLRLYQVYTQPTNTMRTITISAINDSLFDIPCILYAR